MGEIYKNLSLENIEGEVWRDIQGYEGKYQVSSLGRVKSLKDNNGNYREKIMKFGKNIYGYLLVNLHKNGKMKTFSVHRLVATAFLENPNNLPQVNHKDEDKTNNVVGNLEWCTQKYNLNYGSRIAKAVASTDYKARTANTDYKARTAKMDYKSIAEKLTNRQDQSKQVYQYSLDSELIKIWLSTQECKRNGFHQGAVSSCCRGKLKTHKGYIWSYNKL